MTAWHPIPSAPSPGLDPVVPYHRLPEGFLRLLDNPPDPPVIPQPSATLILLRNPSGGVVRGGGLELLLLKRSPRSGFIPGAWVFPGGTVDVEDGDPRWLPYLQGLSPGRARERLHHGHSHPASHPPPWAYWVAAIRETFEETGVLLWTERRKGWPTDPRERAGEPPRVEEKHIALARSRLLKKEEGFLGILEGLGLDLDAGSLEYNGHWLTPECEPRRYETRFFVAEAKPDARVWPHESEMVDALWITPEEALARNRGGGFPLVFPTLFTLEELRRFSTPEEALDSFRDRPVPRRLPEPERAEGGVRFKLAR